MTSTPPSSPNPLGDAAATVDQVPLAVRAIGAELAVAVCALAVVTWGTLQLAGPEAAVRRDQIDTSAAYVNLLLYGTVATLPLTALVGWRLMASIRNTWRRTGLVTTGVLAGMVLGMLATFAARELGGAPGLLVLALLALLTARFLAGAARRADRRADTEAP